MLGPSISALTIPAAILHGLRARRPPSPSRGKATAGLILGAFSVLIPAALTVTWVVAIVSPPVVDGTPVACDCATAPATRLEFRLVATSGGIEFPRRDGGAPVLLEAEPFVTNEDLVEATAHRDENGALRVFLSLDEDAAGRLAQRGVPGKELAVVVGGECVHVSSILMPLPSAFTLHLGLVTDAEACGLQCAAASR